MEESLKALIVRNTELLDLLSKAGIEVPPFVGPKLLRCVVAVQKKDSSITAEEIDNENNVNNANEATKGCKPTLNNVSDKPNSADNNQKPVTKEKRKNTKNVRKTKNSDGVHKIVLDRTFGQRRNAGNIAGKLKLSKSNLSNGPHMNDKNVMNISENSSLETISILEQNVIADGGVEDDRVSVLPLFTQLNGNTLILPNVPIRILIALYCRQREGAK